MKNILFILALIIGLQVSAQEKFRITFKDGTVQDFSVSRIKDVTCIEEKEHSIIGEWVSINQSNGGFDVYSLNEDGTCSWRTCSGSSDYTFDGTFNYSNGVLTLIIYGMEMPYEISWNNDYCFNIESQAFYSMSSEITVPKGEEPVSIGNPNDVVIAVDNVFVGLQDNKIYGRKNGIGYALVQDVEKNQVLSCKVTVVASSDIQATHFDEWLKKSATNILTEFGEKNTRLEKDGYYTLGYTFYSDEISSLIFYVDNETNQVYKITVSFNTAEYMTPYVNDIAARFIYDETSTESRMKYYDNANKSQRTISITISTSSNMITYKDETH